MVLFLLMDRNKHYRFGASSFASSDISSNAKRGQNEK
jgi:hypothetical protein